MTVRLAARFVLAGTLLMPGALSAQSPAVIPQAAPPTNLVLPQGTPPTDLVWRSDALAAARADLAAGMIPQATPPTNLSLTVDPVAPQPAQLRYLGTGETISADARAMKVTYTATGLEVEMTSGSVTFSPNGKDPVTRPFQIWELKFSGGKLIASKLTAAAR